MAGAALAWLAEIGFTDFLKVCKADVFRLLAHVGEDFLYRRHSKYGSTNDTNLSSITLVQVTFHQALADAVFAHQGKAQLRVGRERLERQRDHQQHEHQHAQCKKELLGGGYAEAVGGGEGAV